MRTEAIICSFLASGLHGWRQPEFLEVPIKLSEIANGLKILARRHGTFVVDNSTCRARVTLHLGSLRFLRLGNQTVHVDINCCFKEAGFTAVVILDSGMTRVVV